MVLIIFKKFNLKQNKNIDVRLFSLNMINKKCVYYLLMKEV